MLSSFDRIACLEMYSGDRHLAQLSDQCSRDQSVEVVKGEVSKPKRFYLLINLSFPTIYPYSKKVEQIRETMTFFVIPYLFLVIPTRPCWKGNLLLVFKNMNDDRFVLLKLS